MTKIGELKKTVNKRNENTKNNNKEVIKVSSKLKINAKIINKTKYSKKIYKYKKIGV